MLIIASITFREVLRKKVLLLTSLLSLAFLSLYGLGVYHANKSFDGTEAQMIKMAVVPQLFSMGLYFGNFIIAFLAIFSAVGAISTEVENGIMHAVLSRPIRRREVVLGKFIGYGTMLILGAAVFFIAISLIISVITGYYIPVKSSIIALTLFCFQPLLLLALALLGTVFLSTLANGVALFSLYAVGVIGGILEQIGYFVKNITLKNLGIISSLVIPTDAIYRKIIHIVMSASNLPLLTMQQLGPFGSQAEPSGLMIGYSVFYLLVTLVLAVYIFNRRDV
ncbi:ABC transporter permease subunit [Desulfolucanica intricata]|uniref:ABC transporter permease subunit n=1 Tax=Desulfolucanica intricata TaxID=1285191 RepID=UPI00083197A7|nr:ABC transporter permease subunit [Desulfolucanica intricata]